MSVTRIVYNHNQHETSDHAVELSGLYSDTYEYLEDIGVICFDRVFSVPRDHVRSITTRGEMLPYPTDEEYNLSAPSTVVQVY